MMLKLEKLTKTFGNLKVLDEISVELENINSLGIIGPSGGGKSTLLRLLAGLETITEGSIQLNNYKLNNEKGKKSLEFHKNIGVVFQQYNLFPHLTALRNISLVLEKVHNKSKEEAENITIGLFKKFGLEEHKDKKPHQLSGGQKQRIAIVRALAIDSELLMLDEPTAALDPILTSEVLEMIGLLKKENKDFIIVTHEMGFAKEVCDRVIFMADGEIVEESSPEEMFSNPKNERTKNFLNMVL